jgi:hypothetical protein
MLRGDLPIGPPVDSEPAESLDDTADSCSFESLVRTSPTLSALVDAI